MLYIISGRLNQEGFAFGSLLDRPIVPVVMLLLWWHDIIAGTFALAFIIQDVASFLWTLLTWRSEQRRANVAVQGTAR